MLTLTTTGFTDTRYFNCTRFSPSRIVLVAVAHVGVLALLFNSQHLPASAPAPAIMVQWLTQSSKAPVETRVSPAVQAKHTIEKTVRVAVPKHSPPAVAKTTKKKIAAPIDSTEVNTSENSSHPADLTAPVSNVMAKAHQPTVSEPRFDADYLSNPAPAYPALSRRLGEEGKVILRVYVESAGNPGQVELNKSSGSPRLDQAATTAIWHWKFIPAQRGPEAIGAWVLVPIVFTLRG